MIPEKEWTRFLKSGKVDDYLNYVNSCKENMITDGVADTLHNRGFSNKGNDRRGE